MRKKEIYVGAGSLACALAVGVIMQMTDTADIRYGSVVSQGSTSVQPKTAPDAKQTRSDMIFTADGLKLSNVTDTGAMPDLPALAVLEEPVVRRTKPEIPHLDQLQSPQAVLNAGCASSVEATPADGGNVTLVLESGCHAQARVTVRHGVLVFTPSLDEAGQLTLTVPALAGMARFDVAFDRDTHVTAETQVEDVDQFNRVVLQWNGHSGFELHARAFGALYGGRGHVWHGAIPTRVSATAALNGQLVRLGETLGDAPQISEIYTFPAGHSTSSDEIDLSIEVEVTAENCGQTVEAQALEIVGAQTLGTKAVSFAVPACDAIGDFLVLNNAFEDLKLAAR